MTQHNTTHTCCQAHRYCNMKHMLLFKKSALSSLVTSLFSKKKLHYNTTQACWCSHTHTFHIHAFQHLVEFKLRLEQLLIHTYYMQHCWKPSAHLSQSWLLNAKTNFLLVSNYINTSQNTETYAIEKIYEMLSLYKIRLQYFPSTIVLDRTY
jgi:hypothetical protein